MTVTPDAQRDAERIGFGIIEIENVLLQLQPPDLLKRVPSQKYPGFQVWVFTHQNSISI
jgi:hypothetical protein